MPPYVFSGLSEPERLREALAETGHARVKAFLAAEACDGLRRQLASGAAENWRSDDPYGPHVREVDPDLTAALSAAFGSLAGDGAGDVVAVRHEASRQGLPSFQPVGTGFVLDLNEGWRSGDGGLLLFLDDRDRVEGWRPEPGALTLFDATRPPLLSAVTPSAREPRLAIAGRL